MRKLAWACLAAITAITAWGKANASPSLLSALPPGSSLGLVRSLAVPTGDVVLTYRQRHWHLGVVHRSRAASRLVWQRPLSGRPSSLDAPREPGLFRLVVTDGRSRWLYAYTVRGKHVRSAIHGHSSGRVSGVQVVLQPTGFTLRKQDTEHVGSVPYVFVVQYGWTASGYARSGRVREPDYPLNGYPIPSALTTTHAGDTILIRLEVAVTEAAREHGLMDRAGLDPDSGMIFVYQTDTTQSFWMYHTQIPLSIAFLSASGTVLDVQDMQPETTTLHYPKSPYRYAIEVNEGFFAANGIQLGDVLNLQLGS